MRLRERGGLANCQERLTRGSASLVEIRSGSARVDWELRQLSSSFGVVFLNLGEGVGAEWKILDCLDYQES